MDDPVISPQEMAEIRALLLDSTVSGPRRAQVMAGIPGAGKTTFVARETAAGRFPAGAFILNPDRVMEALPSYRADHASLGAEAAFARWERPARALAYALAQDAAAAGKPIIKDMGMVRPENWDMLAGWKGMGYEIHLHVIHCPVDLAVRSIKDRPRHFPGDRIAQRAAALEKLLELYAHIPHATTHYERRDHDFIQLG